MLKFIGLYQSGKDVKKLNILTAENTNLPKLSSKKSKEKKERELESSLMMSRMDLSKLRLEE